MEIPISKIVRGNKIGTMNTMKTSTEVVQSVKHIIFNQKDL